MGVLLMLITIGGVVFAAVLLIISFLTQSAWLRSFTLGSVVVWFAFYFVMLLGFSIFSGEQTLPVGAAKQYCGFYLDCHMHTAVTDVRTARSIGNKIANGEFYIVKVKVFSDARRATLGLLTVDANVIDDSGNKYYRDEQAEDQLPRQPRFEKKVSPLESFEKEIVFDLPADLSDPRLDMREGYGIDHAIEAVLIGDEDSFLHSRNYFALTDSSEMEIDKTTLMGRVSE
jgi:hypothetical protein